MYSDVPSPRFIVIGDVEIDLKKYEEIHNDFCEIARKLNKSKMEVS